jgi:hypothetical protein
MADASIRAQTSFVSGELSPRLLGRIDLEKYGSGCSELTNFVVLPQGGIQNRSGFRYIAETKSSGVARLVPFQYSITQDYILEFGAGYIRFFADGGQVCSSGTTPLEVATTYTAAELPYLRFAQSADVLYIVHEDHPPAKLSRVSATSFTLSNVSFMWPVFNAENISDVTLTVSATSGPTINFTFSSDAFSKGNVGLTQDHVGMFIQMTHSTLTDGVLVPDAPGYMLISTVTSATTGTAFVLVDMPSTDPETSWSEGSFNAVYGYPRLVTFYEDRLVFAANTFFPDRIWLSQTGDYYNFEYGVSDNDAIGRSINAEQVNSLVWLKSAKKLHYGTIGGEGSLSSGDTGALSPTNVTTTAESRYGTPQTVDAILINNETIFAQRPGKTLRRYAYDYQSDVFSGENLSILSEHLTMTYPIIEMAYQQEPYGILWCVRSDGDLLGLTYLPEHKIAAWHHHTTDGLFESVASIPGTSDDEIWAIVNRTIGGATKRYVERLDPFFVATITEDALFMDSGLTYDGVAATTITGLTHLAGETVTLLCDGANVPDQVVSPTGTITLTDAATVVQVGLPYDMSMTTMPLVMMTNSGAVIGKIKRIAKIVLKLYASHGCKISSDGVTWDTVQFDLVDNEVTLFTGDKDVGFPGGNSTNTKVYIKQDLPLPLTLLAIMPEIMIGG